MHRGDLFEKSFDVSAVRYGFTDDPGRFEASAKKPTAKFQFRSGHNYVK